jgi:hypothetical protein
MKSIFLIACVFLVTLPVFSASKSEIKNRIIQESIDKYSGECPCPYSKDSNGKRCGKKKSAYSKDGGLQVYCFEDDITDKMVKAYKKNKGI